jgi:CHAD domain-containing protein
MKWLRKAIGHERHALERARRRFIGKPTEKRLHDVRTASRRLRSLLEDAADLAPHPRLLRRVKRAAAATDAARDATVILRLLESLVVEEERRIAAPLLQTLRERETAATQLAQRQLRRTRFAR